MKLTVIMLNTWRTLAAAEQGERIPYGRRAVKIELTAEQEQQLKPCLIGNDRGRHVVEEIEQCWLEV